MMYYIQLTIHTTSLLITRTPHQGGSGLPLTHMLWGIGGLRNTESFLGRKRKEILNLLDTTRDSSKIQIGLMPACAKEPRPRM